MQSMPIGCDLSLSPDAVGSMAVCYCQQGPFAVAVMGCILACALAQPFAPGTGFAPLGAAHLHLISGCPASYVAAQNAYDHAFRRPVTGSHHFSKKPVILHRKQERNATDGLRLRS